MDFDAVTNREAEIATKLEKIRAMLAANCLQGVLLTCHYNYSWITAGGKNFVANCFDSGETAIFITMSGCYAFCSVIEEPRIRQEERLEELGFTIVSFGWEKSETIAQIRALADLKRVIADRPLEMVPCRNDLIAPLRWRLTEQECARYQYLGVTMSRILEDYLLTVRPGMTELEIAGGISSALWSHGIEQVMHLVTADERSFHYRHGLPTENRLKKSLIVSINGRYHGLITTVSRMICVGEIPSEIEEKYLACLEIETAAMASTVSGIPKYDIYCCLRDQYARLGWGDMFWRHGQGGCQGYIPREYMFTSQSKGFIEEKHAYCYNPVIDGAKSEDAFIVRNGCIHMITQPVTFPSVCKDVNGQKILRPAIAII